MKLYCKECDEQHEINNPLFKVKTFLPNTLMLQIWDNHYAGCDRCGNKEFYSKDVVKCPKSISPFRQW